MAIYTGARRVRRGDIPEERARVSAERVRAVPSAAESARRMFLSDGNVARLRDELYETGMSPGEVAERARDFVAGGRAEEVAADDPTARRGRTDAHGELRRLNAAFLLAARSGAAETSAESALYDMFERDSLRPPGFESLNEGCLWGGAPGTVRTPARYARGASHWDDEEAPWDEGDPDRTAEEAVAEYYGEFAVDSHSITQRARDRLAARGAVGFSGPRTDAYIAENAPTRLERRPGFPWYQYSNERTKHHERDVEETLGQGLREADQPARRGPARTGPRRRPAYFDL